MGKTVEILAQYVVYEFLILIRLNPQSILIILSEFHIIFLQEEATLCTIHLLSSVQYLQLRQQMLFGTKILRDFMMLDSFQILKK